MAVVEVASGNAKMQEHAEHVAVREEARDQTASAAVAEVPTAVAAVAAVASVAVVEYAA
jgi:hypothetical protein